MDEDIVNKSDSLESLVNRDEINVTELKNKLTEIINIGKDCDNNIDSFLTLLLSNKDPELLSLSVQALAEQCKCDTKRGSFAHANIIQPILNMLQKEITIERIELMKHCCRALGNICCDCDAGRKIILESGGVKTLINLLKKTVDNHNGLLSKLFDVRLYTCKCLLNFTLGGGEMATAVLQEGVVDHLFKVLRTEVDKEEADDDMISTALLILSVINDNEPEYLFKDEVNSLILNILKETSNIEISEICLDHLHMQAEHDTVKTVLAQQGAVQLLCSRLELLVERRAAGDSTADDTEVKELMKQACDLIIIVLTGDDAMKLLYNNGIGEAYLTIIKWLDSTDYDLLTTAVLAVGNFARQDSYCVQMMENNIFDKLLNIFEIYHGFSVRMTKEPDKSFPLDKVTVTRVQHAVLSALRNLMVPVANKRIAAANGRAAPIMLNALPTAQDHHVAYKLLAAIRMLVDGQEAVARQFASNAAALRATVSWGQKVEHAGAAGEAPRLLAWTIKQLRHSTYWQHIVKVDGCVACLVSMLVTSHAVMQNEAVLALTLLAIETLNSKSSPDSQKADASLEESFIAQLMKSEIGKHVSVLIETNCAKMPVEVCENLLAFLDITSKNDDIRTDYKNLKVNEALKTFMESRKDLTQDLRNCILGISLLISGVDSV